MLIESLIQMHRTYRDAAMLPLLCEIFAMQRLCVWTMLQPTPAVNMENRYRS